MPQQIEQMLPARALPRLLHYDAATQQLFWKERPVARPADKFFNRNLAGKRAGSLNGKTTRRVCFRIDGRAMRISEDRVIKALQLGRWSSK